MIIKSYSRFKVQLIIIRWMLLFAEMVHLVIVNSLSTNFVQTLAFQETDWLAKWLILGEILF